MYLYKIISYWGVIRRNFVKSDKLPHTHVLVAHTHTYICRHTNLCGKGRCYLADCFCTFSYRNYFAIDMHVCVCLYICVFVYVYNSLVVAAHTLADI